MLESEPLKYGALQLSIAQAYAQAVLGYIQTGEPHEIAQEGEGFVASPVEPGTSPTDVFVWVADEWECWVPDVHAAELERLGADAFRALIVDRLVSSENTFELLNFFFSREDE